MAAFRGRVADASRSMGVNLRKKKQLQRFAIKCTSRTVCGRVIVLPLQSLHRRLRYSDDDGGGVHSSGSCTHSAQKLLSQAYVNYRICECVCNMHCTMWNYRPHQVHAVHSVIVGTLSEVLFARCARCKQTCPSSRPRCVLHSHHNFAGTHTHTHST